MSPQKRKRRRNITFITFGVVIGLIIVAATGGGKGQTPAQRATAYIKAKRSEATIVQATVLSVQVVLGETVKSPTTAHVDQLALIARQAHDRLDGLRSVFATTDLKGTLGDAELGVFTAANDLKNALGAIVTYTGNPNPATLADMTTQIRQARQEWNAGVRVIWRTAGRAPAPTL